jgi:hypothetical protein
MRFSILALGNVRLWHLADIDADLSVPALRVKRTSQFRALMSANDPPKQTSLGLRLLRE